MQQTLPMLSWLSCSSPISPHIVDEVTDDEDDPAQRREHDREPFAPGVKVGVARILPEVPVGRKQPHSDGGGMLLQLKEALRLPEARLLDRDADLDAVLGVDPRSEDESD